MNTHKIDEILKSILQLDSVLPDLAAETCEAWDSANHLRIVLALEQELGVRFSISEIETVMTRAKLLETIAPKLA
jgi:acyl carrier protein